MSRLKNKYKEEIAPQLMKSFSYPNSMLTPQLKKVVISMGIAVALKDKNALQDSNKELTLISGQKPILTKAKNSISNFKLRDGQEIGAKVTLRKKRMYEFVDRFCNLMVPRIRDFRGFKKKGDGRGNYSLGLEDQQMFLEINLDDVRRSQGMNITFVTTAKTDEECLMLLEQLGIPFKKEN